MKHLKKILALALSLLMMLTFTPISVFATGSEAAPECVCAEACEAERMNETCPVCGAKDAVPENCGKFIFPADNSTDPEGGSAGSEGRDTDPVDGVESSENPSEQSDVEKVKALIDALPDADSISADNSTDPEGGSAGSEDGDTDPVDGVEGSENPSEQSDVEKVKALIDALPDADSISAENAEEVKTQLAAIDAAKAALSDEEQAALNMTRYEDAKAALAELESASMTLYVVLPDTETLTLEGVKAEDTIGSIKTKIQTEKSYATNLQKLFATLNEVKTELEDDRTLSDYGIPVGSTLTLELAYLAKLTDSAGTETKYFDTLFDAFCAVPDKSDTDTVYTVTVLTSRALESNWSTLDNKRLTLDLGGQTLSNCMIVLKNGAELTVVGNGVLEDWSDIEVNANCRLYVKGGSIESVSTMSRNAGDNGIVYLQGGTIGLSLYLKGDAVLTGGTLTKLSQGDYTAMGVLESVLLGDILPEGYALEWADGSTGRPPHSMDESMGKFTGKLPRSTGIKNNDSLNHDCLFYGKTLRVVHCDHSGENAIQDNRCIYCGVREPVASITLNGSTVDYPTLEAAIADAQKIENFGCTVKVLKDVTVENTINIFQGDVFKLDAGNFTVSRDGGFDDLFVISNGGMIIKGGTFLGGGNVITQKGGRLTIEGGSFGKVSIFNSQDSRTSLSGGYFAELYYVNNDSPIAPDALLATGYTYRDSNNKWIEATAPEVLYGVKVVPIPVSIKTQPQGETIAYSNSHNLTVTAEKHEAYADKEISYQWYSVDTGDGGTDKAISGATSAVYQTPDTLTPGTYKYYCKVTVDGYTVQSDTATVTVTTAKLATPTNLRITSPSPGQLTASWDAVANAGSYYMILSCGNGDLQPILETGTSHTFDISEDRDYFVRLQAWPSDKDKDLYTKSNEAYSSTLVFSEVTFDSNGGGTVAPQYVAEGNKATEPTGVEKTGHTLAYWIDKTGNEWNFDNRIFERKNLTAVWTANTYTLTLNTNGGTINSGNVTGYTYGQGATLPTDIARSGFRFDGWYDNAEFSGTAVTEISATDIGDKVYYAKWTDIEAPTGAIEIGTNIWTTFLNRITFGLFFKETQSVTITAIDNSGEPVTIEFLVSSRKIEQTVLENMVFHAYTGPFNIIPDRELVIYAKLTDTSGNAKYINTDGLVLDATAPVISGVENGNTYCEAQTVTVTEKYLDTVTVNGAKKELDENNQFVLNPARGSQAIVVTDKAGNSIAVTVTVNNGHTPAADDGDCTTPVYCIYDNVIVTAAKTHDFTGDWQKDSTHHWRECKNEGCTVTDTKVAHSGGTATCKDKAVCTVCGESYGELSANNHTDLQHFPAVAATKTAEGNIEYWYCAGCGKYFADKDGTKEITKADTVMAKLPDDSKSPQTGDNSNLLLWIALLFISGGAVTATTVCGRKKKRSLK